jgi:hypothetical protein
MWHISETAKRIRFVFLLSLVILSLVVLAGTYGCTNSSGGPGGGSSKDGNSGCTDNDGDGFYAEEGCGKRVDCNDEDPTINPVAPEYCVGIDNDCDGLVDEDCLPEACGDNVDNDGDGVIDESCRQGLSIFSDTGQTRCYDTSEFLYPCPAPGQDFYGQDACYSTVSSPFTKLDAGGAPLTNDATYWAMVKDNVTGLIWEIKTDDTTIHDKDYRYTWADASDIFIYKINEENFGGYSDWRLPSALELNSIMDLRHCHPAIDMDYFPNTMANPYWSITTIADRKGYARVLDFSEGNLFGEDLVIRCSVRAVRGAPLSVTFTDNGDGTVTTAHNGRSLMWMQASSAESMPWQQALSYCENLTFAGYSDWRLPNIKELRAIIDNETSQPAINLGFFPDTQSVSYWSSTTCACEPDKAWIVGFYGGGSNGGNEKASASLVRAVRGGL